MTAVTESTTLSPALRAAVREAVRERVALLRRLDRRALRAEARGDCALAASLLEQVARLVGRIPAPDRPLSVAEAAEQVGVHTRTIYRMVRTGELAHVRASHCIRIPAQAVALYLASRTSHTWRRVDRRGRPESPT